MEFIIKIVIFFILGFVLSRIWNDFTVYVVKTYKRAHVKGFHFHHSLFGLINLLFSLYYFLVGDTAKSVILTSFGIGIIAEHTASVCGFVFITKD